MGSLVVAVVGVVVAVAAAHQVAVLLRSRRLAPIHAARDVAALEAIGGAPVPAALAIEGSWLLLRGRVVTGPLGAVAAMLPAPAAVALVDNHRLLLVEPTLTRGRSALVERRAGPLDRWGLGYADPSHSVLVVFALDGGPYNSLRSRGWLPIPVDQDRTP